MLVGLAGWAPSLASTTNEWCPRVSFSARHTPNISRPLAQAISEIGVSFPDETFGTESRIGVPFTFLLRDILQWDLTLDDSVNRMSNAKRTCNLILGVGDGKLPAFRSVQYSGSNIRFFDDQNMQPVYDWHPRMKNVVYYGMDWLCPGYTKVLSEQLTLHHGNITAEIAISDIVAYTQTGNLGNPPLTSQPSGPNRHALNPLSRPFHL
jgi:hypothetical protein